MLQPDQVKVGSRKIRKLWRVSYWLVAFLVFWLGGCTRYVPMDDPSLKPFADMYAVDRAQYGLSPLPRNARVYIETADNGDRWMPLGYDVMLHIDNKAVHHVAFRKQGGVYKWVGEQEQCWGPREFKSVNGVFKEDLAISFFHHAANHLEGLDISYTGPDRSLSFRQIPVSEAKRILKQWGCE